MLGQLPLLPGGGPLDAFVNGDGGAQVLLAPGADAAAVAQFGQQAEAPGGFAEPEGAPVVRLRAVGEAMDQRHGPVVELPVGVAEGAAGGSVGGAAALELLGGDGQFVVQHRVAGAAEGFQSGGPLGEGQPEVIEVVGPGGVEDEAVPVELAGQGVADGDRFVGGHQRIGVPTQQVEGAGAGGVRAVQRGGGVLLADLDRAVRRQQGFLAPPEFAVGDAQAVVGPAPQRVHFFLRFFGEGQHFPEDAVRLLHPPPFQVSPPQVVVGVGDVDGVAGLPRQLQPLARRVDGRGQVLLEGQQHARELVVEPPAVVGVVGQVGPPVVQRQFDGVARRLVLAGLHEAAREVPVAALDVVVVHHRQGAQFVHRRAQQRLRPPRVLLDEEFGQVHPVGGAADVGEGVQAVPQFQRAAVVAFGHGMFPLHRQMELAEGGEELGGQGIPPPPGHVRGVEVLDHFQAPWARLLLPKIGAEGHVEGVEARVLGQLRRQGRRQGQEEQGYPEGAEVSGGKAAGRASVHRDRLGSESLAIYGVRRRRGRGRRAKRGVPLRARPRVPA